MVESFLLGIMITVTAVQSIVLRGSSISCGCHNCLKDQTLAVNDVGITAAARLRVIARETEGKKSQEREDSTSSVAQGCCMTFTL